MTVTAVQALSSQNKGASVAPASPPSSPAGAVNSQGQIVNSQGVVIGQARSVDTTPNSTPAPASSSPASGGSAIPTVSSSTSSSADTSVTPQVGDPSNYTVAQGDTLSQIASKNNTSIQAIMRANPSITNPNLIKAGASLVIPGQVTPTGAGGPAGSAGAIQSKIYSSLNGVSDFSDSAAVRNAANGSAESPDTTPQDPVSQYTASVISDIGAVTNVENTRESIEQYQNEVSDQLGIPALQTQAMNLTNIMNGNDQSVRDEITAAGGSASESQIEGMVATRNKVLGIQLADVQAQLANANTNLGNMVSAYGADTSTMVGNAKDQLNNDETVLGLYTSSTNSVVSNYKSIMTANGPAYLASLLADNPQGQAMAEKYLGFAPGTLSNPTIVNSLQSSFFKQQQLALSGQRLTLQLTNAGIGGTDALSVSRYAMAATRIGTNYVQLPAYQIVAGASPYLARIEAAAENPNSVSDEDLLDSFIKLNTGGNAVTDSQASLITGGQTASQFVAVLQNKMAGTGGVLAPEQRAQLEQLAKSEYGIYQKLFQPIYNEYQTKLSTSGIDPAYGTMPDLNNLSQLGGISGDGTGPGTVTIGNNSYTSGQTLTGTGADGKPLTLTVQSDGTLQGSDGNIYDSNGNIITQ